MNFVLIGPVYPYRGGIAQYTRGLTHSLLDRGHQVQVFSFQRQYPNWLYPGKSDKDPSQTTLNIIPNYTLDPLYPWSWSRTAKQIVKSNPDAVLIQWWTTFWGPAYWRLSKILRRSGIFVIYIIHNVIPHEPFFWDKWIAENVLKIGDAHLVQATSEEDKLLSFLPDAEPIYSPLPVFNFFPSNHAISKTETKARFGLKEDIPLLLFFGIVRAYKGLKHAIESVSLLNEYGLYAHLIVAGEFWEDIAVYRDQISQLNIGDQVTLVDKYIPDEEVGSYFSAADVFVAPYIDGTQSATVKTALGFNLPIVVTECVADEILRNSNLVSIVPSGSSKAIAEAISELLLVNNYDQISISQMEKSWERQVSAIESLVQGDDTNPDNAK